MKGQQALVIFALTMVMSGVQAAGKDAQRGIHTIGRLRAVKLNYERHGAINGNSPAKNMELLVNYNRSFSLLPFLHQYTKDANLLNELLNDFVPPDLVTFAQKTLQSTKSPLTPGHFEGTDPLGNAEEIKFSNPDTVFAKDDAVKAYVEKMPKHEFVPAPWKGADAHKIGYLNVLAHAQYLVGDARVTPERMNAIEWPTSPEAEVALRRVAHEYDLFDKLNYFKLDLPDALHLFSLTKAEEIEMNEAAIAKTLHDHLATNSAPENADKAVRALVALAGHSKAGFINRVFAKVHELAQADPQDPSLKQVDVDTPNIAPIFEEARQVKPQEQPVQENQIVEATAPIPHNTPEVLKKPPIPPPSKEAAELFNTPTAKKIYERIEPLLMAGRPILLYGPKSSLKQTIVHNYHEREQRGLIVIPATAQMTEEDLLGHPTKVNGKGVLSDGPLTRAIREKVGLLILNIDRLPGKVMEGVINPLFDDQARRYLPSPRSNEELIIDKKQAGEGFQLIATIDVKNESEIENVSPAIMRRLTPVYTPLQTDGEVIDAIEAKYPGKIPSDVLDELLKAHASMVKSTDENTLGEELGMKFNGRHAFLVADRWVKYRDKNKKLNDMQLLAREFNEVYAGALYDNKSTVESSLMNMFGVTDLNFYKDLTVSVRDGALHIGDASYPIRIPEGREQFANLTVPGSKNNGEAVTAVISKMLGRPLKAIDLHSDMVEALYKGLKIISSPKENLFWVGPAGLGKTEGLNFLFSHVGLGIGRPAQDEGSSFALALGEETERGYVGKWLLKMLTAVGLKKKDDSQGKDQKDQQVKQGGGGAFFDEINKGEPALIQSAKPLLTRRGTYYNIGTNEVVPVDKDFHLLIAGNPPNEKFAAASQLDPDIQPYFTVVVSEDPSEEALKTTGKFMAREMKVNEQWGERLVTVHLHALKEWRKVLAQANEDDGPMTFTPGKIRSSLETIMGQFKKLPMLEAKTAFINAVRSNYASTSKDSYNDAVMKQAEQVIDDDPIKLGKP